jgi:hypothetical protein
MFAQGARKLAFHSRGYYLFSQLSNLLGAAQVEVKVEVKAYTTCSHTAPARWLSAANSIAN